MAEDFKSLEAVSVAIDGIKSQLALMSKVFFWTAGGGALALGYLLITTNSISVAVGKIETKLEAHDQRFNAIDKRLDGIEKQLGDIVALMRPPKQQGQLEGPTFSPFDKTPTPTTFEGYVGVAVDKPDKALADWKSMGLKERPTDKLWIYYKDR